VKLNQKKAKKARKNYMKAKKKRLTKQKKGVAAATPDPRRCGAY
jgi:hypothetical protein